MTSNTIILFGANGGIGSCLKEQLEQDNHIISVCSDDIDFSNANSFKLVKDLIDRSDPDIIINCAGVLGDNNSDFNYIFNINLRSNWCILKSYFNTKISKRIKIIFIGSSSYSHGKKDYMLYSSSKAALFNLYEGAKDYFNDTKIIIGLINPSRVDTKMISHLPKNKNNFYFDPIELSKTIKKFIIQLEKSNYINLNK